MGFKMNTSTARKKWKLAEERFEEAFEDAAAAHIEVVFAQTQIRVPKDTGRLAETGRIENNSTGRRHVSNSIWYGEPGEGPGVIDYAAAVHEILSASHSPPTGAKFVEVPLIQSDLVAREILRAATRRAKKQSFG